MQYLLDTEVWLWMKAHPDRIGHHTLGIITDEQNDLVLAAAAVLGKRVEWNLVDADG